MNYKQFLNFITKSENKQFFTLQIHILIAAHLRFFYLRYKSSMKFTALNRQILMCQIIFIEIFGNVSWKLYVLDNTEMH